MTAPMNDWTAPATIFCIASTRIGTGASARSSIVRCQENSITSGNVTAMMPCMSSMDADQARHENGGEVDAARGAVPAVADPPPRLKPPPIFGKT